MKIEGRLAAPLSPSDSKVFYHKRFPEPWMVAVGFVSVVAGPDERRPGAGIAEPTQGA